VQGKGQTLRPRWLRFAGVTGRGRKKRLGSWGQAAWRVAGDRDRCGQMFGACVPVRVLARRSENSTSTSLKGPNSRAGDTPGGGPSWKKKRRRRVNQFSFFQKYHVMDGAQFRYLIG
jgi:hypothetical protein